MLVPEFLLFELRFVGLVVEALENILESTIVFLQDRVLGGQVQWVTSLESELEAAMPESFD